MNLRKSWMRGAFVAGAAALVMTGCGSSSSVRPVAQPSTSGVQPASSAAAANYNLNDPTKLTVGMNLQFKPEMYLQDGKPAGYDVDLLQKLATSMGVKLDIQNLDFNGLIPGLQSKKFDLVSVGLSDTAQRRTAVDFTRGYVPYVQILGVPQNTKTPATIEAYNMGGKTITALQGSTGEKLAATTFPNAKQATFPDQNAALLQVATGRADGIVVENYLLAQFQKSNPGKLKEATLSKPLALEYGSYAVQKGNAAFVQYLNEWLCSAQKDGSLAKTYEAAFGVDKAPEFPVC